MRLTWFGESTFRLYLGGGIFVLDAARAPEGVDAQEVAAAADYNFLLGPGLAALSDFNPETWQPTPAKRLIDEESASAAKVFALGETGVLIDEAEEGPVILTAAGQYEWGRFADDAMVVFFGAPEVVAEDALKLLDVARPMMIAMASSGFSDTHFEEVAQKAGRCALQVLEAGFAIEA